MDPEAAAKAAAEAQAKHAVDPVRKPEDAVLFVPITANNASEHAYRLGIGKHLPRLSDKDEAALEGRYCRSQTP